MYENYKMTIKELRARYNVPQKELSENIGISKSRLQQLENDSSEIRLSLARNIAKFFNVPFDSIYFGKSSEITINKEGA